MDAQLLFDAVVLAVSMFVLFTFLSYMLFEPVRNMLETRRERVVADQESAKLSSDEAAKLRGEYEAKMQGADKEVENILSEARKKAQKQEAKIVAEAKEEANRIMERAQGEIELEKKRAIDEVKQDVISIASMMAEKVVAASIDTTVQNTLVEETLKEMGEGTWQN